jgi:hypothetical protein
VMVRSHLRIRCGAAGNADEGRNARARVVIYPCQAAFQVKAA